MSLSFWSGSSTSESSVSDSQPRLTTLNILVALAAGGLISFDSGALKVREDSIRVAGSGGFSTVEVGSTTVSPLGPAALAADDIKPSNRELFAVKRSKLFPRSFKPVDPHTYDKHLVQLSTELRILSHDRLRQHPNILNVLGICLDGTDSARPPLLVCEYAEWGTLKSFLGKEGTNISLGQRIDLVSQVSSGLTAVHCLKISHGDVKTDNVLVFSEQSSWLVKISDFGQSLVAPVAEQVATGDIDPPSGTPLLNAPEIRTGACFLQLSFTIEDAMLTDIFSFGLLAWEVFNDGKSYFNQNWPGYCGTAADVELMQQYLNGLPLNQLCRYGMQFFDEFFDNIGAAEARELSALCQTMELCLQDDPRQREPMSRVKECFREFTSGDAMPEIYESEKIHAPFTSFLPDWSFHKSFLFDEIFRHKGRSANMINNLPKTFQAKILGELEVIINAEEIPRHVRAHAAMTASEFHTCVAMSEEYEVEKAVRWLRVAAILGHPKATLWYDRVCHATDIAPLAYKAEFLHFTEDIISVVPSATYLTTRIHTLNASIREHAHRAMHSVKTGTSTELVDTHFKMSLFNDLDVDTPTPFHLAAWFGDVSGVLDLLPISNSNTKSNLGLNAAHYACLGGNISTLNTLIEHRVDVSERAFHDITPLHLAIFIPLDDIDEAVRLLLDNGASADVSTEKVSWDAHDIILSGTPLEWAVSARNLPLVKRLAPHSSAHVSHGLGIAVEHFFWEIAEELISWCTAPHQTPWVSRPFNHLTFIRRPFSHWIAHGSDHFVAIQKTVQFCCDHNLLVHGYQDDMSHLYVYLGLCMFSDDLYLAKALISIWPESYAKSWNFDALHWALVRSQHNSHWREILKDLSEYYTVEELQETIGDDGATFFELSVHFDSTVGVRVFLEKGVDVNHRGPDEPAINWWVTGSGSEEMLTLLLEYGANIQTQIQDGTILNNAKLGFESIFDYLLSGFTWNRGGLFAFIGHVLNEGNCARLLHRAIFWAIWGQPRTGLENLNGRDRPSYTYWTYHPQYIDMFRALLTQDIVRGHLDDVDEEGLTLLQKSTTFLHVECTRLLLEAGANPCIPIAEQPVGSTTRSVLEFMKGYYPLHLCCTLVRMEAIYWLQRQWGVPLSVDSELFGNLFAENQPREEHPPQEEYPAWGAHSQAMEIAVELLHYHETRGDDLFQGISRPELAWTMLYVPELEEMKGMPFDEILAVELNTNSPVPMKKILSALIKRNYIPFYLFDPNMFERWMAKRGKVPFEADQPESSQLQEKKSTSSRNPGLSN